MSKQIQIKNLIYCSLLFSLEIIILALTYFYSLFHYQLNWLSYSWYFISWWSVQTDLLILLFALGGLIYFSKQKYCHFVTNHLFVLYIVFAALLTFLFFTIGSVIGAITRQTFTASWNNITIYWISTVVQHWLCPIIFIIYFCFRFVNCKYKCNKSINLIITYFIWKK